MGIRRAVSGYAGLAFVAFLIVGFALDMAIIASGGGQPPQLSATNIGPDLVRAGGSGIWGIELWVYAGAVLPFAIFLPGARAALTARGGSWVDVGIIAGALFIALHTLHNLAYAAVVTGLAPSYVAGTPAAAATEQVARGLIALAETAFLPGGGIGGGIQVLALASLGMAQRRSGSGRTATLALGSAAVMGLAYLLRPIIPGDPPTLVALMGWIAFIAWSTVTSLGLVRDRAVVPVRAATAAAS